jgi:hypothetical protein
MIVVHGLPWTSGIACGHSRFFYFVSRPIGFEKYILYKKGGMPNERTGKTQSNRTAHHTPAQGKTHPA